KLHCLRMVSMRQWNTCTTSSGTGGSNTGNRFKKDTMAYHFLKLLSAARKDKRVAAFKSYNCFTCQCVLDQQLIDAFLRQRMIGSAFTDEYLLCCWFAHIQDIL